MYDENKSGKSGAHREITTRFKWIHGSPETIESMLPDKSFCAMINFEEATKHGTPIDDNNVL